VSAPDLALALLRRNARLRAWRAYGVPVEGGWEEWSDGGVWDFRVRCLACGGTHTAGLIFEAVLAAEERAIKRHLLSGCPHLAPLLGDDPPEVTAIAELELLAGA
jgi:hypothetical protein